MRLKVFLSSFFMVCLVSSQAFAAIPLITDDTGTQGKGKFQLELAGEYGHDKDDIVTNKNSDFSATLTYGVVDSLNIVLSVPYQFWHTDEKGSEIKGHGISDIAIETKWRFYENEGLSFALKPGFTIPTGDDKKDLGNGKMTYYLYLIASKEVKPWSFNLNLSYIRNNNTGDDRKDIWHASFASTVDVMKNLKLVGDVGIETNPESSSATPPVYILGGLIYSVSDNLDIGLGVKGGLTKSETDLAVRGGITFRF